MHLYLNTMTLAAQTQTLPGPQGAQRGTGLLGPAGWEGERLLTHSLKVSSDPTADAPAAVVQIKDLAGDVALLFFHRAKKPVKLENFKLFKILAAALVCPCCCPACCCAPCSHGIARHGTARHCTARHSIAWHSVARCSVAQHGVVWHSTALCGTEQHSTARHGAAQHGTAWHSTARSSTAQQGFLRCASNRGDAH